MTPSEHRLLASFHDVMRTDLVAQMLLLPVFAWVGSPWLWLAWSARWVTLLALYLARRAIRHDRTVDAVTIMVLGHGVSGIAAAVAVPDAAPLVMLVILGDLTRAAYVPAGRVRRYFALCLAVAAAVALASLAPWSDVPDIAPVWLIALVLGPHALVTGWITARESREVYTRLHDHGERLRSLAVRIREADRDEQLRVARDLASGTDGDLARLAGDVRGLRADLTHPVAGATVAARTLDVATDAKASLARLRVLSHGLYPDVLHQHGLRAAITSLDHLAGGGHGTSWIVVADHPDRRLSPAVESTLYACVVAVANAAGPKAGLAVAVRRRRSNAELVVCGEGVGLDHHEVSRMTDRVNAAGGDIEVTQDAASVLVHVAVPFDPPPTAPAGADAGTAPILSRFITSSLVLCSLGLPLSALVWAVTGLAPIGVVVGVLVVVMASLLLARAAERRGDRLTALALLCFETSFAGLLVTAAVPVFAPTAALIVVLPLALGLPYLSRRQLDMVGVAQTVTAAAVVVLGIADTGSIGAPPIPGWISASLLAPTVVAVGLLVVVVLVEGRSAIEAGNRRLRGALASLISAADSTRRGIERDLHDGAQQHLAALAIQMTVVGQIAHDPARATAVLDQVDHQISQARDELRMLVDGSFAATLQAVGLGPALGRAGEWAAGRISVIVDGVDDLPGPQALAVYFACNEAVQNAVKHAGDAAQIEVAVIGEGDGRRAEFRVHDDGRGCDPAALAVGRGITALRRRMHEAGGELDTWSAPGQGTTVTGWVPVRVDATTLT